MFIVSRFLNPDLSFPHIKLVPSIKYIWILVIMAIPKGIYQTILSLECMEPFNNVINSLAFQWLLWGKCNWKDQQVNLDTCLHCAVEAYEQTCLWSHSEKQFCLFPVGCRHPQYDRSKQQNLRYNIIVYPGPRVMEDKWNSYIPPCLEFKKKKRELNCYQTSS